MKAEELFNKFQQLLVSNEIDPKSATLSKNKTDYSIKFKGNIIFKFKPGNTDCIYIKKDFQDEVLKRYEHDICQFTSAFMILPVTEINNFDENFSDLLLLIVQKLLGQYTADEFGCCSRYLECSDAKHCVHPNHIESLGCAYKRNLEKGLIFYGKNKNR